MLFAFQVVEKDASPGAQFLGIVVLMGLFALVCWAMRAGEPKDK